MTWTLRLYDSDGVEVCWITANPYEYVITHPDGDSAWLGLRCELSGHKDMSIHDSSSTKLSIGTLISQVEHYRDPDPKDHLEQIRDMHLPTDEIDSAQLADE